MFHPAINGYPTLFRAGDDEGGEEDGRHPILFTALPVQVGSLAATSPTWPLWRTETIVALFYMNMLTSEWKSFYVKWIQLGSLS